MASGDRVCPNCGQWQVYCMCGWAAARQRGPGWPEIPVEIDWSKTETFTMDNPPKGWFTTTTTKTLKPRRRRHFWQEVYR